MTDILQNNDLIFYKNDQGNIMSGGYDVESYMLRNGVSPMRTLNFEQNDKNEQNEQNEQNGGNDKKISNGFKNLAVPVGLYYITQTQSTRKYKENQKYNEEHTPLPDDIFDKLFEMIEYDDKKKRKTKKHFLNVTKKYKKTKKQNLK
jgi:hypothetical protein